MADIAMIVGNYTEVDEVVEDARTAGAGALPSITPGIVLVGNSVP